MFSSETAKLKLRITAVVNRVPLADVAHNELPDLELHCLPYSLLTFQYDIWMDDDLRFYILFNSISVISGRRAYDNERLCVMEPPLRLRRFPLELGSNPGPLNQ